MNIQLTPFKLHSNYTQHTQNNNNKSYNRYSNNNLSPLAQDCVSFSGKKRKRVIEEEELDTSMKSKDLDAQSRKSNRITYLMASEINEESQKAMKKFVNTLRIGLKNVVESDKNPNLPILRGKAGIHGRVKKAASIMQKVPPRGLKTKDEIFKMGDVIGARIILKDSSRKSFDMVFKELGKMVTAGQLNILEVENYRLTPNESYVSQKTLDNFELACAKAGQSPKITSSAIKSGYTAIHLTVKLPDGEYAEIQIMGRDMEKVKDIEDFYYKRRCEKPIDAKYKPVDDMFDAVLGKKMEKLDDFQKETLDRYIQDSYRHARELPPRDARKAGVGKDYFIPIPYSLPPELSFENLYKLKERCDNVDIDNETVKRIIEESQGRNRRTNKKDQT